MLLLQMTLDLCGEQFSPRKLLPQLITPVEVVLSEEPAEIADDALGFLSLRQPNALGIQYDLERYQQWYIDFICQNHGLFVQHSVAEIALFMNVFYSGQCNFEILSLQQLKQLAPFNVALPISVYALETDRLRDMLRDTGYSQTFIDKVFQYE